ncbi:hypothetical protein RA271_27600, partial [Pseudomonas syringae pv. tagetis]
LLELHVLSIHLPFDSAHGVAQVQILRALHDRMLDVLLLSSAVEDSIARLRSPEAGAMDATGWRDLLQARAPGYRDRIVHVSLQGDEGGMNLDMPQEVLTRIADKGSLAGARFCSFSFENHYWIRWRNLASAYQRYTLEVARTDDPAQQVLAYRAAYAMVARGEPSPPSYKLGSEDKRLASQ